MILIVFLKKKSNRFSGRASQKSQFVNLGFLSYVYYEPTHITIHLNTSHSDAELQLQSGPCFKFLWEVGLVGGHMSLGAGPWGDQWLPATPHTHPAFHSPRSKGWSRPKHLKLMQPAAL